MLSNSYIRPQAAELLRRLQEPRRFLQVITGPRQVGKTTLATQVAEQSGLPHRFGSADEPTLRGPDWIAQQWEAARLVAAEAGPRGALLVIDEVQKAPNWAESVKRLWDEDTRGGLSLKVVLTGSAQLLIGRGLTESLAGRFELLHLPHWSWSEMRTAFGWSLEQFLFHGAYPGAAPLVDQPDRWARYVRDSLVETTLARDVLLLSRVDKPALLRRLFDLGCEYSGQILSYTKMLGQLQDAGNTTTLAHYLELLAGAGMLTGLQKYSGAVVRRRSSSPKLQVLNTALMTAGTGITLEQARVDGEFRRRLVESAVGAHLADAAASGPLRAVLLASPQPRGRFRGARGTVADGDRGQERTFAWDPAVNGRLRRDASSPTRSLLVGGDLDPGGKQFRSRPAEHWTGPVIRNGARPLAGEMQSYRGWGLSWGLCQSRSP